MRSSTHGSASESSPRWQRVKSLTFVELKELLERDRRESLRPRAEAGERRLLRCTKGFDGRVPCTVYRLTEEGRKGARPLSRPDGGADPGRPAPLRKPAGGAGSEPAAILRGPMRWSQSFLVTLREVPGDAEVVSHQLLYRAGHDPEARGGHLLVHAVRLPVAQEDDRDRPRGDGRDGRPGGRPPDPPAEGALGRVGALGPLPSTTASSSTSRTARRASSRSRRRPRRP